MAILSSGSLSTQGSLHEGSEVSARLWRIDRIRNNGKIGTHSTNIYTVYLTMF